MPIDYSKYPDDWKEISKFVRFERAQNRCECIGECGLHKDHPGARRCSEINGQQAQYALGKIVLTVAHLCHDTHCRDLRHLRAMCQKCHLRYDRDLHRKHSKKRRELESGQMRLLG